MTFDDNRNMLIRLKDSTFSGITELNLSCPNIPGKPQIAYDFDTTQKILEQVFSFYDKPLGVKLPPYFDQVHFEQMANILNQFPLSYVNCINSVGNGLYINIENESTVIKPKNGFGGIGGQYIKPVALSNVRAFYTLLNPGISIIGCGGVQNGQDLFEHILCGASMVQIGTELEKEGCTIFTRILLELQNIMLSKGYRSIDDFKGKLKTL